MFLNSYNEFDDIPISVDEQDDTPLVGEGDGIFTCVECASPLDEGDECSDPACRLHPTNGGYGAHHND